MRLMNRTWVWISILHLRVPVYEPPKTTSTSTDTDTDTDTDINIDTDIGNGTDTNERSILLKTLDDKIDLQYKRIQLEAGKLTKRRRELRKKDPLNDGPDSSDDSIDEKAPKRARTSGGIKPRKQRNKKNETYKQADGKSKRLYTYSDSEQDSEGHDPTGNVRTKKRVKLSRSKENFMSYIQRGPADGFQSRSLVRPDDDLLGAPMANGQQQKYQAPFMINKKRKVAGDAVVVQLGDRREHLDKAIFKKGYYRIVVYLKERYTLEEGSILEYTTANSPDPTILDSEEAFANFSNDLIESEGTIHVTPSLAAPKPTPATFLLTTRIRYRNCVVMTEAKPNNYTKNYPWNISSIKDVSEFSSFDDFMKALLKGNEWEQWYPNLLTVWCTPTPEIGYILFTEDEFKKLKSKPKQVVWVEIRKNYEGTAVSSSPREPYQLLLYI